MKTVINLKKIEEILTRGVEKIYPSKELLKKSLISGKKLKIYFGVDPSGSNLHLGHAICFKKMRQFQDLGHKIIFLIGDFTSRIGDPSDKNAMRPKLSHQQVLENAKTYKKQVAKILNFESKTNPCEIKFNSKWLDQLTNKEIIEIAGCFTVQQMMERDLFQKRIKEKKPIGIHEFLYPLYQGYDSVFMNIDMEIGGEEQTFNMLMGRTLMKIYQKKEKFVLTVPLLEGTDGRKMSKSWGNTVNILDSPENMFGKIMSLSDIFIIKYFVLCTDVSLERIKKMEKDLSSNIINPRDLKIDLAREIVSFYHNKIDAKKAENEFIRVFQKKEMPSKVFQIKIKEKSLNILDILIRTKLVSSKSEAKRLIFQKGVKIDKKIKEDWKENIFIKKELILQIGKRKFIKIIPIK